MTSRTRDELMIQGGNQNPVDLMCRNGVAQPQMTSVSRCEAHGSRSAASQQPRSHDHAQ